MKTGLKLILAALLIVAGAFLSTSIALGVSDSLSLSFNPKAWFIGSVTVTTALVLFNKQREYNVFRSVAVELWVEYIINNLFKDQSFMNYCFNESDYVLGGAVVHIPQAGAKPTVVKNRSSYPATTVRRSDTDIIYPLDVFTTDPTLITNAEQMEISYDKMASVLGEHVQSMGETIGDNIIYSWRAEAAANIVRTTGGSGISLAPSATGNRKIFTKDELKKAQFIMNKQNISKENRYALLPSEFLNELYADSTLLARDAQWGGELDLKEGRILKLYGFTILERSDVLIYDNTGTPIAKAVGASGAADDNLAALCWQQNCVAKAMGGIDFFERLKDPTNYGDIYSALVKMGARKRRENAEGVVAIVQAAV